MNRILQYLNIIGVLVLGVLVLAQCRVNQHLNLELKRLESIRLNYSEKIDERDKTLSGYLGDLERLREHLTRLTGDLKEIEGKLKTAEHQVAQLSVERDQLKANVKQWSEALNGRDEQLKIAHQQISELAAGNRETVLKFNELATNYNSVVKDLNDRTRQFQELMAKFNELARR